MDRFNLTIEIQADNIGAKRVNIRSSLMTENLLVAIKDKFNLDGNFELRLKGQKTPMPSGGALDQLGVADGGMLVCARMRESTGTQDIIERGQPAPISAGFTRVFLREENSLNDYELNWTPAIIGRRDRKSPVNNRLLAVDLEGLEELPSVSRHHAAITESAGGFFLEALQARNPVYLNDERLNPDTKYVLPAGSTIRVGKFMLSFVLVA